MAVIADSTAAAPLPRGPFERLRILNVGVGFAHLVQATAMLVLSNDLALPVTAAYLAGDPIASRAAAQHP